MIRLDTHELNALNELAKAEHRDTRQQAALLVRRQLENLGLIEPVIPAPTSPITADKGKAAK